MSDEVKLLPCDLDDATAEQIERANEAVGYNMNEDGTPKWQSAQGYACALAAIMLSDSSASRICNALAEFATFADDFPQDAPNTTSVQGTLGMCRRAKALLATRPPIGTDEVVGPNLGAIPGSHPTDQAPSGLGASRFDPERSEVGCPYELTDDRTTVWLDGYQAALRWMREETQ